jgi:hypothetical protein
MVTSTNSGLVHQLHDVASTVEWNLQVGHLWDLQPWMID